MKKITYIVILLAVAMILGGCSGKGKQAGSLVLGIWPGNDPEWTTIEQLRQNFEAENGIPIEWRIYDSANLSVQIQADLAAGTAPDAFYVDSSLVEQFVELGVLSPLDKSVFNTSAFYQNTLDTFTFNGTVYAIPKDQSSLARYVNTGLLAEAGFTLADIPDSLEGYLEFLPRLQAALDARFGAGRVFAASGVIDPARLLHLINRDASPFLANGDSNMSDPLVERHVEFIYSLFATGAMRTPQQMGAGWNGEALATERAVITEEGNWVYPFLLNQFPQVKFEVLEMPTYQGKRSGMIFTVGWGINAASAKRDMATKWIQYVTGPEGMYDWTIGAGILPARPDVAARMESELAPGLRTHIEQIPFSTPWVMGRFTSIISGAFMNFMGAAMEGTMSVQEAMRNADAQANLQIGFAR